jgi:hypothetical protein
MDPRKHFDTSSIVVIVLTFALFVIALFVKGLTHDLLLEAGVLLVSIKLILMAYKHGIADRALHERLDAIHLELSRLSRPAPPEGAREPGRVTGDPAPRHPGGAS